MTFINTRQASASKNGQVVPKGHTGGWQTKLKALLDKHNKVRANNTRQVSDRTREKRENDIFHIFRDLRDQLGYKLEDPSNLKKKHVEALVKFWIEEGLAPETISNKLSILRIACQWMGKENMVLSLKDYSPELKTSYVAKRDKSWSGNNVDFFRIWDKVNAKNQDVAIQLLLVAAFGMRRAEAVNFKPLIHAASGKFVDLYDGAKNKRHRRVDIDTELKKVVVQIAKDYVRSKGKWAKGFLGNPDKTLEQNIDVYSNVLSNAGITKRDEGVTGHGLRAEFAMDELKSRGLVATIAGGSGKADNEIDTHVAYHVVSELLGHSRKSVMTAYCGGFRVDQIKANKAKRDGESSRDKVDAERLEWKSDALSELAKRGLIPKDMTL